MEKWKRNHGERIKALTAIPSLLPELKAIMLINLHPLPLDKPLKVSTAVDALWLHISLLTDVQTPAPLDPH